MIWPYISPNGEITGTNGQQTYEKKLNMVSQQRNMTQNCAWRHMPASPNTWEMEESEIQGQTELHVTQLHEVSLGYIRVPQKRKGGEGRRGGQKKGNQITIRLYSNLLVGQSQVVEPGVPGLGRRAGSRVSQGHLRSCLQAGPSNNSRGRWETRTLHVAGGKVKCSLCCGKQFGSYSKCLLQSYHTN